MFIVVYIFFVCEKCASDFLNNDIIPLINAKGRFKLYQDVASNHVKEKEKPQHGVHPKIPPSISLSGT